MGSIVDEMRNYTAVHLQVRVDLLRSVEGTMLNKTESVIAVLQVGSLECGDIDMYTGGVYFEVSFTALLFKPFVQETVDVIVKEVNPVSGDRACLISASGKVRRRLKMVTTGHHHAKMKERILSIVKNIVRFLARVHT